MPKINETLREQEELINYEINANLFSNDDDIQNILKIVKIKINEMNIIKIINKTLDDSVSAERVKL
jgi:hypothetical protein